MEFWNDNSDLSAKKIPIRKCSCQSSCHIISPVFIISAWEWTSVRTFHLPASWLLNKTKMAINHHEGRIGGVGGGDKASGGFFEKKITSASTQSRDKHQPDTQFFILWLKLSRLVRFFFIFMYLNPPAIDLPSLLWLYGFFFFFFICQRAGRHNTTKS